MVKWLAGSLGVGFFLPLGKRPVERSLVDLIPLLKGIPLYDKRTFRGKFGISVQVPAGMTSVIGLCISG